MQRGPLKLSKRAKDRLTQLTRHTGIEHRNVLCRWAIAAAPTPQAQQAPMGEAALSIEWSTICGAHETAILAIDRCGNRRATIEDVVHAALVPLSATRGLAELVQLALGENKAQSGHASEPSR